MPPERKRNEDQEIQEKPLSIGPFLKTERAKKGFTLDQVAGLTRLRRYILEAIENENWRVLPAPVFVKGFIRSYARALDLDDHDLEARYAHIRELKTPSPRPLTESKRARGRPVIVMLSTLVVVIIIILVWLIYKADNAILIGPDQLPEIGLEQESDDPPRQEEPVLPGRQDTAETAWIQETEREGESEAGPERIEKAKKPEKTIQEQKIEASDRAGEPVSARLILKSRVLENTWLKITIDDQAPREYMFQPGSMPQWEAENGFDLLIGNAAGIEFEFNEQRYKDLGRRGQVIRLQFPEEFKASVPEE